MAPRSHLPSLRVCLGLASALLALASTTSSVEAQAASVLGRANEARTDGRFEEAETLYDEASRQDSMTRADVLELLRGRALARAAQRRTEPARSDLRALFSLEPEASFGAEVPPSFVRLADEIRDSSTGPLSVNVSPTRSGDGWTLEVTVQGEPGPGLVSGVRILRLTETGVSPIAVERVSAEGRYDAQIEAAPSIRYVVEVLGFGGAVLASAGSLAEPRVAESELPLGPIPAADETALHLGLAFGIGGAVILGVAGVLLALFLPSGRTQLSPLFLIP